MCFLGLYQKYFYLLIPSLSTFYSTFSVTLALSTNPQQIKDCFHTLIDLILQQSSLFGQPLMESSLYCHLDDKQRMKLRKPKGSLKQDHIKHKKDGWVLSCSPRDDMSHITKWTDEAAKIFERLNYALAEEICRESLRDTHSTLQKSLLTTRITLHIHPFLENELFSDEAISVDCSPAENQVTLSAKVCSQLQRNPKYSFLPQECDWVNDTSLLLRHFEFRIHSTLFQIDFSLYAAIQLLGYFNTNDAVEMNVIVHRGPFTSQPLIPSYSFEKDSFSPTISSILSSIQHLLSMAPCSADVINHPLNRLIEKLIKNEEVILGNLFPSLLKGIMKTVPQLFDFNVRMKCLYICLS